MGEGTLSATNSTDLVMEYLIKLGNAAKHAQGYVSEHGDDIVDCPWVTDIYACYGAFQGMFGVKLPFPK